MEPGKKSRNNNIGQASHGEQQRGLEMFPDFNRPRDPHHHSHPFKHKPTPYPSDQTPSLYELSPPYPSLYKHHRLPYLPSTQNKQHQGEDKNSSSSIPHERVLEISPVSPPPVPSLIQSPPCLKPSAYPSFPPTVTHSAP